MYSDQLFVLLLLHYKYTSILKSDHCNQRCQCVNISLFFIMSHISDPHYWTTHFMNQDKKLSENNNLYSLDQKGSGINEKLVKVVTPGPYCNLRDRPCIVVRQGIKRKRSTTASSTEPKRKKRKSTKKSNKIKKKKKTVQLNRRAQRRKTRVTSQKKKTRSTTNRRKKRRYTNRKK